MSNEEFERQMEFILQQQVRFEANLEQQRQQSAEEWAQQREREAESWERHQRLSEQEWAKQREREAESWERQQRLSEQEWAKQRERDAHLDRKIEELVSSLSLMREAVIGLTHHVERHDFEMAEIRRTLAEQAERGKETDSRLNALMVVVERHISGHQ